MNIENHMWFLSKLGGEDDEQTKFIICIIFREKKTAAEVCWNVCWYHSIDRRTRDIS